MTTKNFHQEQEFQIIRYNSFAATWTRLFACIDKMWNTASESGPTAVRSSVHVKFHVYRCNVSPLRERKNHFWTNE